MNRHPHDVLDRSAAQPLQETSQADGETRLSVEEQWFLCGEFGRDKLVQHVPVDVSPFRIGRRGENELCLADGTVSGWHAELSLVKGSLLLRDLDSRNGTFVNGQRIHGPQLVGDGDVLQFGTSLLNVSTATSEADGRTIASDVGDDALAAVQFGKLIADRAVVPLFQPIVRLATREVHGFELLSRSRLYGLESPATMFRAAERLHSELELSELMRAEGILAASSLPEKTCVFLNMHPAELSMERLVASLAMARQECGDRQVVLEVHEGAVTDFTILKELDAALDEMGIGLAFDDFGAGQARLLELVEVRPDFLKFDLNLVRNIDRAPAERQRMVETLVGLSRDFGVVPLAEGVETEQEAETCLRLGFEMAQGYLYGRLRPAAEWRDGSDRP